MHITLRATLRHNSALKCMNVSGELIQRVEAYGNFNSPRRRIILPGFMPHTRRLSCHPRPGTLCIEIRIVAGERLSPSIVLRRPRHVVINGARVIREMPLENATPRYRDITSPLRRSFVIGNISRAALMSRFEMDATAPSQTVEAFT